MKTLFCVLLICGGLMGCSDRGPDPIHDQFVRINHKIDIRNEIDAEYAEMSNELVMLGDPKVAKVMQPHIRKINALADSLKETR